MCSSTSTYCAGEDWKRHESSNRTCDEPLPCVLYSWEHDVEVLQQGNWTYWHICLRKAFSNFSPDEGVNSESLWVIKKSSSLIMKLVCEILIYTRTVILWSMVNLWAVALAFAVLGPGHGQIWPVASRPLMLCKKSSVIHEDFVST